MLHFLPHWLRGSLAVLLISLNTLLWFPFVFIAGLVKLIIPIAAVSRACTSFAIAVAEIWISANGFFLDLLHNIKWEINGLEGLSKEHWYFVTCNHQTWADIPIVQYVLNGKAPMIKFFLKQELIWVPLLGLAWWALDFPFMKRFSKEYLKRHPEKKGEDLETTRKACEKFKYQPVSIFNFLEGTRFTDAKHRAQDSSYQHLLKPKAGGAAFVINSMGNQLRTMLDITIVYPDRSPGFWEFLSGKYEKIVIDIERITIPEHFAEQDYLNDGEFKVEFQQWISALWRKKDEKLSRLRAPV